MVGRVGGAFVLGAALAARLGAGMVLCRKKGKLPAETIEENYSKEYGTDTLEIHKDAINSNDIVLLHDDLLATGGTMKAAYNLCQSLQHRHHCIHVIVENKDKELHDSDLLPKEVEGSALLSM